jgi:hypothetical protein
MLGEGTRCRNPGDTAAMLRADRVAIAGEIA